MTKETLNHANNIVSSVGILDGMLRHISVNHRMKIRFDWSESCMESHDTFSCPDWLVGVIKDEIKAKKVELQQELDRL